jgi:hypothetical protein
VAAAALAIPELVALIFSAYCSGIRVDFHPPAYVIARDSGPASTAARIDLTKCDHVTQMSLSGPRVRFAQRPATALLPFFRHRFVGGRWRPPQEPLKSVGPLSVLSGIPP